MIIGGDLNFTLGVHEFWGPKERMDPLAYFFTNFIHNLKLIDLDPQKLKPTWTNKRVGENRVEKRLDRFLLEETLLEKDFMFK